MIAETLTPAQATLDTQATLMARLRAETRGPHERVEAAAFSASITGERISRRAYVAQLHAWRTFVNALESALDDRAADHDVLGSVWRPDTQRKTPRLDADLAFLDPDSVGAHPLAQRAAYSYAAHMADAPALALLGHLYVHEGSSLGGLVLRKHLSRALGLSEHGLSFHAGHGRETMARWREFKARMDSAPLSPREQDAVVLAANDAFDRTGEVLVALADLV
jgi:heme oxygenase